MSESNGKGDRSHRALGRRAFVVASDTAFAGLAWWRYRKTDSAPDEAAPLGQPSQVTMWHRRNDRTGIAFVANGIVAAHQQYLALGGLVFLLGDGGVTYGPETIFEGFYTAHLWPEFKRPETVKADNQAIGNCVAK